MLEQVENKIQELQRLQKEEYYKKKDEDLLEWGLTSKKDGKKKIPVIVTDDEYEALIEASSGIKGANRNKVAAVLNVASVITIILGVIAGGVFASFAENLSAVYFSVSVVVAILLSLVFKGLSEAITLLQQILDTKRAEDFKKLSKEVRKPFPDAQPSTQQFTAAPPVHFAYPGNQNTVFTAENVVYGEQNIGQN